MNKQKIIGMLEAHEKDLSNSHFHESNYGVPSGDYEDVANEIVQALIEEMADDARQANLKRMRELVSVVADTERDISGILRAHFPIGSLWTIAANSSCTARGVEITGYGLSGSILGQVLVGYTQPNPTDGDFYCVPERLTPVVL